MASSNELTFSISIDRDQWLRYYAGHANAVRATAHCGTVLQLPASAFRQLMGHDCVHGPFRVRFDDASRLIDIVRLSRASQAGT